jgi:hypothetical protein
MAYQASGKLPDELANAPEKPVLGNHVWDWFLELNRARSTGGFSVSPLSYFDIAAWSSLTKTRIEPWELKALCLLDEEYIAGANEK